MLLTRLGVKDGDGWAMMQAVAESRGGDERKRGFLSAG
jgi:hypothetical protein